MSDTNTALSLVHSNASVEISTTRESFAPKTLTEAMQFADMLAKSSFVPKDFQGKPGDIVVAIQWGCEVGLAPLQALQNIAVISGRPTIWGDAALGIVQAHPEYVRHEEGIKGEGDKMIGWHTITRKNQQPHTVEFSVADAKKAGLWDKAGPWKNYPQRMLKLRARGWAIRDKFSDALKGIITREEAQDMGPTIDAEPTPIAKQVATISPEQAMDFYKAWKIVHTIDEAKAYLADECGVTDSRKMPLAAFEQAMLWATTPTPKKEVSDEDADAMRSINQAFDILGTPDLMQAGLLKDYEGRLGELKTVLEAQLSD